MGYADLITPGARATQYLDFAGTVPNLVSPAIGTERHLAAGPSACLRRCRTFSFSLRKEDVSHDDRDIQRKDVFLYFPSRSVVIFLCVCVTR